jgi:hypothetical protein
MPEALVVALARVLESARDTTIREDEMMFDYQISSQVAETRRQDLLAAARISRLRKDVLTRTAEVRPQRRWLGFGARQRTQPAQTSCPTAA